MRRKTGSICRIHFGDIILSWPASYLTAGFKLQWASSPAAMNWEEIPNELIFINPSSTILPVPRGRPASRRSLAADRNSTASAGHEHATVQHRSNWRSALAQGEIEFRKTRLRTGGAHAFHLTQPGRHSAVEWVPSVLTCKSASTSTHTRNWTRRRP